MQVLLFRFLKLTPVFLLSLTLSCGGGGGGGGSPLPTNPIASIIVEPASATLAKGGIQQFTATARDSAGTPIPGTSFIWTSSNVNVAQIDPSGLAQGVAEGAVTISASAGGISGSTPIEVTFRIFQEPVVYQVGKTPQSAAIGDFNGDGFKDLAVANADDIILTILKGSSGGGGARRGGPGPTGA